MRHRRVNAIPCMVVFAIVSWESLSSPSSSSPSSLSPRQSHHFRLLLSSHRGRKFLYFATFTPIFDGGRATCFDHRTRFSLTGAPAQHALRFSQELMVKKIA
ncbi:hypothetical protein BC830DRAFT_1114748 [Chytriomyces sp. MP71]|nr:hypothetical protein BC830DRAFT_1114748 [Chytriomyces sp. MP71]